MLLFCYFIYVSNMLQCSYEEVWQMSIIGDNIKSVRENRRMTQDELAEITGVHRVTLAKYE